MKLICLITHGMGDWYHPLSILDSIMEERKIEKEDLKIYVDSVYFSYESNYADCLRDTGRKLIEAVTKNWEPVPKQFFGSGDWYGIPNRQEGPMYENIKHDFLFYRKQELKDWAKQFICNDNILICGMQKWSYEWKNGVNIPLLNYQRKKLDFNIQFWQSDALTLNDDLKQNRCILIHCRKKGAVITDIYFNDIIKMCLRNKFKPVLIGLRDEVKIEKNSDVFDLRGIIGPEANIYLIENCKYFITSASMFTWHRFLCNRLPENKPTIIGLFESNGSRQASFFQEDLDNPNNIIYDADKPHLEQIKQHIEQWRKDEQS